MTLGSIILMINISEWCLTLTTVMRCRYISYARSTCLQKLRFFSNQEK